MQPKLDIAGQYQVQGTRLTSPEKPFTLILDYRKRPGSGKPLSFLLAKAKPGSTFETGRTDQYVSSVYPVPGQPFGRVEYQGIQYRFQVTETGATVTRWESDMTSPGRNGLV